MTAVLKIKHELVNQLEDVQASADRRCLAIQKVGIKDLSYPIIFNDKQNNQQTRATCNMYVSLAAEQRGTHMSRFISLMNKHYQTFNVEKFQTLPKEVARRLEADSSKIEFNFTYFRWKKAPISGFESAMDYNVFLTGEYVDGKTETLIKVEVPVTSLCPCSKNISDYGAHNQRSLITITVKLKQLIWVEDIIEIAEKSASAEVFGLLKREDEKYLTEHAYENPKFVEDIVRDVSLNLQNDDRFEGFIVETENFESIHNHSAYAMIDQMS
ncbi:MAG: GTP cyclohydrolase I FolE2 [Proteobacteria bacterium]|nr:GTP cyclohydrolase I FolE2 [Pseudomonadota bacterium]NOG59533.1 GTP cyclohydrolase I FolE2 [Pseudomonadota bacterium]